MREDSQYFEFYGLRFVPRTGELKVAETGKEIALSETQRRFLLALLEKAGDLVSYEDLRQRVWSHETSVDRRVQHTIHVTKRNLIGVLEGYGLKGDFIESAPGKGYRLIAPVNSTLASVSENVGSEDVSTKVSAAIPQIVAPIERPLNGHFTFVAVTSVLFGFLFWIALILEVAYRFDLYISYALWLGLSMWVLNSLWLSAALALAWKRLREQRGDGLFVGLSILILGVIGTCGLASWCLPDVPITASTLQAQPALAAFIKNALLYFLPLGFFFVLCPFYFVVASELKTQRITSEVSMSIIFIKPKVLLGIALGAIVYSLISTFYMLDNLLPGKYHGLFVSLVFVRFLLYFGLAIGSTLWYKAALPE